MVVEVEGAATDRQIPMQIKVADTIKTPATPILNRPPIHMHNSLPNRSNRMEGDNSKEGDMTIDTPDSKPLLREATVSLEISFGCGLGGC